MSSARVRPILGAVRTPATGGDVGSAGQPGGIARSRAAASASTSSRLQKANLTWLRPAGFDVFTPQGTYFITTDIGRLSEAGGLDFCRRLPHECGVVAVPNAVFYDNQDAGRQQVRFAFCKRDEVLAEAAGRLRQAFSERRD